MVARCPARPPAQGGTQRRSTRARPNLGPSAPDAAQAKAGQLLGLHPRRLPDQRPKTLPERQNRQPDATEEVRSGDGPLSVRVRPSSPKRDCARRTTSTGGNAPANVHAKSRLTLQTTADPPVRNQGSGRSLPGPDAGHPLQGSGRLATKGLHRGGQRQQRPTASTGDRRQPITPRTIRRNLGYVRPEKRTVGGGEHHNRPASQ